MIFQAVKYSKNNDSKDIENTESNLKNLIFLMGHNLNDLFVTDSERSSHCICNDY